MDLFLETLEDQVGCSPGAHPVLARAMIAAFRYDGSVGQASMIWARSGLICGLRAKVGPRFLVEFP